MVVQAVLLAVPNVARVGLGDVENSEHVGDGDVGKVERVGDASFWIPLTMLEKNRSERCFLCFVLPTTGGGNASVSEDRAHSALPAPGYV